MDLKDCIKVCTKINKNQTVSNVKWSTIPKKQNQKSHRWQQALPYHLELEKRLFDPSNEEKHEIQDDKDDEKLEFTEITQSIRKGGFLGWDVTGIEERFKQQCECAKETADKSGSESNTSFTTARTSTISLTEDSFSSAILDMQYLKIDGTDEKVLNHDKEESVKSRALKDINQNKVLYKKNALMRGLLLSAESKLGKEVSTDFNNEKKTHSMHGIQSEKENPNQDKNKQSKHRNRKRKNSRSRKNTAKSSQTLKQSNKNGSKQKYPSEKRKYGATEADRKFFMDISDECFGFIENKKSTKSLTKM